MIKAVVFDFDGTLYPEKELRTRMIFDFWKNMKFFLKIHKVRKKIRDIQANSNVPSNRTEFLNLQAKELAKTLNWSINKAYSTMEKIFYSTSFSNKFKKINPYPGVVDLILKLKAQGLKIGVMSDFPLQVKVKNLTGVEDSFWDIFYTSEDIGYLKPNKMAFLRIIECLNFSENNILYVGNSYSYDIVGAKNVGMRTAYFATQLENTKLADFVFQDYLALDEYIFSNTKQGKSI